MFLYNWQVRDDWFNWCETLSLEELRKKRVGGMGSFLHNLFHVIDCEQIWVNQMQGTPVIIKDINKISSLEEVKIFSEQTRKVTQNFIKSYTSEGKDKVLEKNNRNGTTKLFPYDKIIRHIVSHEIHHIGQLSVWSREIGLKAVSSDYIFREFL